MLFKTILGLAAIVAAKPIATNGNETSLETRGIIRVTTKELNSIKFFSQHAAAAYCNSDTATGQPLRCNNAACPLVMLNKPVVVASMALSGKFTGVGAYVAIDFRRKEIVFAVRGSNNIRNYITDMIFAWSDCDLTPQCKLHAGFAAAWNEIRGTALNAIKSAHRQYPNYKIVSTGHSLGAAIATIGAAYLRRDGLAVDLYTFGSPRIGNNKFANWFISRPGGHWRVTHESDIIPRLPPIFMGYRHVSPEYWLSGGSSEQTDYSVSQVSVCSGIANTQCNGSRFTPDMFAHLYYLGDTAACAAFPLHLRDGNSEEGSLPQDLMDRLASWSQQDHQLAGTFYYLDDSEYVDGNEFVETNEI
ncbi:lipase [Metarhizium rileyi]|uniref:Lipase n=1 Tax=Metarhizium rileyi (strain RCEF 4871) TaxID=1649241 RepID=A0A167CW36_METRR|nr:lipase [Metarhizium rileyi RCEF 4871]TWU73370.1 hypothetical protein ED733_001399 [Metarhizium rileyi]